MNSVQPLVSCLSLSCHSLVNVGETGYLFPVISAFAFTELPYNTIVQCHCWLLTNDDFPPLQLEYE